MRNDSNESGICNSNLSAQDMPRSRLDDILDQATRCKLVYVIAGAGYGKTRAVRHYIEQRQDAVVRWIQLTESDNMGPRYWENVTHSISSDNPDLAAKLRELGFPETLARFKQFAELIRNGEHRSHKTVLVLDDFHLIHSKEALLFAERCAHLQIPGACVIILSRTEPELNVVSLRSKGSISVITEDALRFTAAETGTFFQLHRIPLSAQDISQLMDATKGWALAINMCSAILKRIPNNFKYALDTVRQNISKLLEIEAWDGFSENIQKTLVQISLLSDLPVISLQEFSADTDFLQTALGLTSFIWFDSFTNDIRIHPLYLEFLQGKQHILSNKEKQETYEQAARWCFENGFYMDALHYYAKSNQFERMVQTLLAYPFKLSRDTSEYFLRILEDLDPENGAETDPHVLFLKNCFIPILLTGADRYEEAQVRAHAVIREWEHMDTPLAILFLHMSYSNLAYIDMYTCTVTHTYNSPMHLKKSVEYFKRSSIPPAKVSKSFINADVRSFACLVGEGADLTEFDQFLEAARQTELYTEETPYQIYAGYAELVACEIAFFKNQPDLARKHAYNAIRKAREKEQYSIEAMAEKYLLRIAVQEGNAALAKELLKQLRMHLDNPDFWNRQLYHDVYTGVFYAKIGRLELVPRWFVMDEAETASEIRIPARELYVSALYYITAQKYHQALTILSNSYPREPEERFLFGEVRFSLLTAVAQIHTGDIPGAMAEFEKAYRLSFQGVFELFFMELGKELHPLIVTALRQADCGIPADWLKTIDRKASIYAKKVAVVANAFQDRADTKESVALSEREREVLLDLYQGLSREEIAVNRHLSINTVKKALQSIYIKLDAQNNVDAVRIALEKKLIE
ncbi:MAG: LuxR C-terminal-related transcriptional regulator [Oscillospiraceae bacterium]|nr:LuxR C-terminal-related transcriptional regulator [Oscillospiraceae bacterium]